MATALQRASSGLDIGGLGVIHEPHTGHRADWLKGVFEPAEAIDGRRHGAGRYADPVGDGRRGNHVAQ